MSCLHPAVIARTQYIIHVSPSNSPPAQQTNERKDLLGGERGLGRGSAPNSVPGPAGEACLETLRICLKLRFVSCSCYRQGKDRRRHVLLQPCPFSHAVTTRRKRPAPQAPKTDPPKIRCGLPTLLTPMRGVSRTARNNRKRTKSEEQIKIKVVGDETCSPPVYLPVGRCSR